MSPKLKTIELARAVTWFDKTITHVAVREPNGADAINEPVFFMPDARTGRSFPVENAEVIGGLIDRLLVLPDGKLPDGGMPPMSMFCLEDGIAIKGAVTGFFEEAALAIFSKRQRSSQSSTESSVG